MKSDRRIVGGGFAKLLVHADADANYGVWGAGHLMVSLRTDFESEIH
jgi:hypothetical protein